MRTLIGRCTVPALSAQQTLSHVCFRLIHHHDSRAAGRLSMSYLIWFDEEHVKRIQRFSRNLAV